MVRVPTSGTGLRPRFVAWQRQTCGSAALLVELSERARSYIYEIPGSAFATVGQGVARHLLYLASDREEHAPHQPSEELTGAVTQQELADAVGSVRAVVVAGVASWGERAWFGGRVTGSLSSIRPDSSNSRS